MSQQPEEEQTDAARFFQSRPDVRAIVEGSESFRRWRDALPAQEIDGKNFHVLGGDMLRDDVELMLDWASMNGVVNQKDIDAARRQQRG